MKLFKKLFAQEEPPSMQKLVADEIQSVAKTVFLEQEIEADTLYLDLITDRMEWFKIRPRNYGESGSHYGVAEISAQPGVDDPRWPVWTRHVPTSKLKDARLAMWKLAQDRRPLGGHMMEEENRRRAVCEFAGRLLSDLLEKEEDARVD